MEYSYISVGRGTSRGIKSLARDLAVESEKLSQTLPLSPRNPQSLDPLHQYHQHPAHPRESRLMETVMVVMWWKTLLHPKKT